MAEVVAFYRNHTTYIGLVNREMGLVYHVITAEIENYEQNTTNPSRYWRIPKTEILRVFRETGPIFKLLYL